MPQRLQSGSIIQVLHSGENIPPLGDRSCQCPQVEVESRAEQDDECLLPSERVESVFFLK